MEVHLVLHGPEWQIDKFCEDLSKRKYPFEGTRKGYCRPYICTTKQITIKAKKEVMPMILSDLKASTTEISSSTCGYRPVNRAVNLMDTGMKWAIRLTNFMFKFSGIRLRNRKYIKSENEKLIHIDMAKVPKGKDILKGWLYSKVLFAHSDPERRPGEEEL